MTGTCPAPSPGSHLTVAEGEFAFTACTGTRDGQAVAFYDVFRLEHAMIAEHWSVTTETPTDLPRSAVAPPPACRVDRVMRSLLDPVV